MRPERALLRLVRIVMRRVVENKRKNKSKKVMKIYKTKITNKNNKKFEAET